MSTLDHTLKPEAVRRLEMITGTGRRRRFSDDDKVRIVEETLVAGAVVSEVDLHSSSSHVAGGPAPDSCAAKNDDVAPFTCLRQDLQHDWPRDIRRRTTWDGLANRAVPSFAGPELMRTLSYTGPYVKRTALECMGHLWMNLAKEARHGDDDLTDQFESYWTSTPNLIGAVH